MKIQETAKNLTIKFNSIPRLYCDIKQLLTCFAPPKCHSVLLFAVVVDQQTLALQQNLHRAIFDAIKSTQLF